jgi:RHS repeat-associated protein
VDGRFGESGAHAPFGESYSYTGGFPLVFTGQDGDSFANNTTYYFPERQYQSSQGRWLSPDPAGLGAVDPNNPQSWNRYAYVLNNPLSAIDPDGLWCVWENNPATGESAGHDDDTSNSGATKENCDALGGHWDPYDTITGVVTDANGNVTQINYAANGKSGSYNPVGMTLEGFDQTLNGGYSVAAKRGGILNDIGNWFRTAKLLGVGGSLWIPPNPKYPVGWSPGVNFVSDGTNIHGCVSLAAGGVGAKRPGGSYGPLFGDPSKAPAIIQEVSVTVNVNFPVLIPFLPNPGFQIIASSAGTLAGPTVGTSGVSVQAGYSWPCTP